MPRRIWTHPQGWRRQTNNEVPGKCFVLRIQISVIIDASLETPQAGTGPFTGVYHCTNQRWSVRPKPSNKGSQTDSKRHRDGPVSGRSERRYCLVIIEKQQEQAGWLMGSTTFNGRVLSRSRTPPPSRQQMTRNKCKDIGLRSRDQLFIFTTRRTCNVWHVASDTHKGDYMPSSLTEILTSPRGEVPSLARRTSPPWEKRKWWKYSRILYWIRMLVSDIVNPV